MIEFFVGRIFSSMFFSSTFSMKKNRPEKNWSIFLADFVHQHFGGSNAANAELPSIFHYFISDGWLQGLAWLGLRLRL